MQDPSNIPPQADEAAVNVALPEATAVGEPPEPPPKLAPVASYLHTAATVLIMMGVAFMSWKSAKQFEQPHSPLVMYLPTMIWLWLLFAFVTVGLRRRNVPLREIFGTPWKSFDDFIMDVVIAIAFWFAAVLVLGVLGVAFLSSQRQHMQDATKVLQGLAPHGALGISMWIVLSLTAGICEEFVFRGYLQRQFSALTSSVVGGVILSAMVFALGHLYEGGAKAALIGVFGAMFGALAAWKKNLRPGIMAHAWHDIFSGLLLSAITTHLHK